MQIENLKRWHWIVIGLVLGLAISYMWANIETTASGRSIVKSEFERSLSQPPIKGYPILRNIIVYPARKAEVDFESRAGKPIERKVSFVALEQLSRNKDGTFEYRHWILSAEVPYHITSASPEEGMTIEKHLAQMAQKNPSITFTYAWWWEPRRIYLLGTLGSTLLIGGVWPFILNLLIGAGFGKKTKAEPEYDLSRFDKKEKSEPAPAPKPPTPQFSQGDLDQIDQLEKNLQGFVRATPPAQPASPTAPPPVRKLETSPLEALPAVPEEEDSKEFRGEFYPVARDTKKP